MRGAGIPWLREGRQQEVENYQKAKQGSSFTPVSHILAPGRDTYPLLELYNFCYSVGSPCTRCLFVRAYSAIIYRPFIFDQGENQIEIIPAVDIRGGRCVRLYQGDYSQETVYSDNPVEVALRWQSMGAPRVHVVDLDGAAGGKLANQGIIEEIARSLLIPVQLGGGIREVETIEQLLKAGVDRVVLGTVAAEEPQVVQEACKRFRESIIVAIDVREGHLATRGWRKETGLEVIPFALSMVKLGVSRFIYTDISRDGTLTEPNFAGFSELKEALRVPVIASGGISTLNHIKMLRKLGAEGVIIGKALYTGGIKLKEALTKESEAYPLI